MQSLDTAQFQAPIPGMSLMTEPQNRPWETPAKYSAPEDALTFYIEKLTTAQKSSELLGILELGYPVANLIDTITLGGVMQGLHTIDVAIVISPALYELITGMADAVGIEYKNGVTDIPSDASQTLLARASKRPEAEELVEEVEEEEIQNLAEAATGGLMARPAADEMQEI
jgi:hypothetical protein